MQKSGGLKKDFNVKIPNFTATKTVWSLKQISSCNNLKTLQYDFLLFSLYIHL